MKRLIALAVMMAIMLTPALAYRGYDLDDYYDDLEDYYDDYYDDLEDYYDDYYDNLDDFYERQDRKLWRAMHYGFDNYYSRYWNPYRWH